MADNSLTINIDGPRIPADKFVEAIKALYDLLGEVTSEMGDKYSDLHWLASVRSGSNMVIFSPEGNPDLARLASGAIVAGFNSLQSGSKKRPEYFSFRAMGKAKDIVGILDVEQKTINKVELIHSKTHLLLTDNVRESADRWIAPKHADMGTIEGKLELIESHTGFKYAIYDEISKARVKCHSIDEKEVEYKKIIHQAFERRVSLHGLINYSVEGRPISMIVRDIRVLRDSKDIPSYKDVQKAFE